MSTNANVFNSRVTSEALEAKFRQVFPAQAGAELIQDLYASGVIQPVIDFSSVAEGSGLPENLQTAWDFATGNVSVENTTTSMITNPGFWKIDCVGAITVAGADRTVNITLSDGITTKTIWEFTQPGASGTVLTTGTAAQDTFVVFVRTGETVSAGSTALDAIITASYRQIADVNGNLVNPLGFTFS